MRKILLLLVAFLLTASVVAFASMCCGSIFVTSQTSFNYMGAEVTHKKGSVVGQPSTHSSIESELASIMAVAISA